MYNAPWPALAAGFLALGGWALWTRRWLVFATAFLAVLPYVLYQVWAFVAPGLYAHEKRLVLPLVVSSTLLFVAGMALKVPRPSPFSTSP